MLLKTSIALLGAMAATPVAAATLLLAAQGPGSADKLACAFDPEEGVIFHAPEATPEFEVGDTPELQGESFTYAEAGISSGPSSRRWHRSSSRRSTLSVRCRYSSRRATTTPR